jgi:hypothetical protein
LPQHRPNVEFVRPELQAILSIYALIRDAIVGQTAVKLKEEDYLPKPNPLDISPENAARYAAYLLRAVFYNVTSRTLAGLTGQVFARAPVVLIPDELTPLISDVDGTGITLDQQAKKAMSRSIAFGRSGLLTDFPTTGGTVTKQQLMAGDIRPTITCYEPENIINWRTIMRGALKILSLVVLAEKFDEADDGFRAISTRQWRVLELDEEGLYVMTIFREVAVANTKDIVINAVEHFVPVDANGKRLTEIPFIFVGAQHNDSEIDEPPLHDIALLNIAHYRNSADYEESSFQVGQPTPFFTGLTQDWVEEVLKGQVQLGSRAAIPLPEGATAGLLQANPNTMPFEAMAHKERQMVAIGAKLIDPKTVERTATEAGIDNASETSVLAASADNVSAAMQFSLEKAALFAGVSGEKIEYRLSTDFSATKMTAQERAQLVNEWVSGAISFTELRENMRKSGLTSETDEDARAMIATELKERQAAQPVAATSQPAQE